MVETALAVFTVNRLWAGRWQNKALLAVDSVGFRLASDGDPAPSGHIPGALLPGFRDGHVHLGLVDGGALLAGGIASVDDFGWTLDLAGTWPGAPHLPEVKIAGQFLTARHGYPSTSAWAPDGAVRELDGPEDVPAAVDSQLKAGASFIKVVANIDAGPVLNDETLAAIVAYAHDRGVPVAAHVEGEGQAARAFAAGADIFAHTPWTERLDDDLLSAMATSMTWVSTLDIHGWGEPDDGFAVASDNIRRFHEAGGDIRYGTDLGNGPLPLGINLRELLALEHAGLGLDALAGSISRPSAQGLGRQLSHIAGDDHDSPAAWLSTAQLISPDTVKEIIA